MSLISLHTLRPLRPCCLAIYLSIAELRTPRWYSQISVRRPFLMRMASRSLISVLHAISQPLWCRVCCCCHQRCSLCLTCWCTLMQQSSQCSLPMSACVKARGLGFWAVLSSPFEFSSSSSRASAAGFVARNHLNTSPCLSVQCYSSKAIAERYSKSSCIKEAGAYIWWPEEPEGKQHSVDGSLKAGNKLVHISASLHAGEWLQEESWHCGALCLEQGRHPEP